MTRIKFCGLTRPEDVEAANRLLPDYIGFVFWKKSRRCIAAEAAGRLRRLLRPGIAAVGVFVDEAPEEAARLLDAGIIDLAQLHGNEDEDYIRRLKALTDKPVIKAFRIRTAEDVLRAERSGADLVLADAGMGSGSTFDWSLLRELKRPYFLAGGLNADNAAEAVRTLRPWALDVSSGIESGGVKDAGKMAAFEAAVRRADAGRKTKS